TGGGRFTNDELSYDIYAQVAKALRRSGASAPLGGAEGEDDPGRGRLAVGGPDDRLLRQGPSPEREGLRRVRLRRRHRPGTARSRTGVPGALGDGRPLSGASAGHE